jgi:hypothetical protein
VGIFSLPAIHLAPVGDSGDDHQALVVVDGIDDAIVADSDSIVVAACELDHSFGPRLGSKTVDRGGDAVA